MKKLSAIVLALVLAVSLCAVFSVADEGDPVAIKNITFSSAADGAVTAHPRGASTDISVLIDGDVVEGASTHTTTGIVLFCNTLCKDADENPEFSLVIELEKAANVTGAAISLYEEYNSMIGTPKDGIVTVEYSDDGEDFIYINEFDLGCANANEEYAAGNNSPVVETCAIDFGRIINTKFFRFTFAYGESPWQDGSGDGKVVWEWLGLTEVYVNAVEESEAVVDPTPSDTPDTPDTPADSENLALGATVVGGEPALVISEGQWPCDYSGKVTDGNISDASYGNLWADFYFNGDSSYNNYDGVVGDIVLDFGSSKDFTSFRTHVWGLGASGIAEIEKIEISVSDDGENWTSVASTTDVPKGAEPGWAEVVANASGRYVKYSYTKSTENGGAHMFISECEAYGASSGSTSTPPTPGTADSGIIALAVISALAVAGAVIVKKSR